MRMFSREEGASGHCQLDSPERMPPVLFPWLNRVFSPRPPSDADLQADAEGFDKAESLMKKHHGAEFAALIREFRQRGEARIQARVAGR